MKRILLATVFGLWLPAASAAQELNLGIDFATVIPRGEFKQNIDNNGYGVGLQFTVGIGPGPLHLGIDFAHTTYGSESREVPLLPDVPEVTVDVRTSNNITLIHFLLRLQPTEGAVRPYIDGLIGFKYLDTRTSFESDIDDLPLASETNFSDTAFSYGAGGGVQVRLAGLGSGGSCCLTESSATFAEPMPDTCAKARSGARTGWSSLTRSLRARMCWRRSSA
ncbi:MAG TPA: hypothetical protein VNO14_12670 [Blastocatellia bacterium]|nr:hypothetical protein [Blastocatellia bacterium]